MALGIGIAFIVLGLAALVRLRRFGAGAPVPIGEVLAQADLVLDVRDAAAFKKGHLDRALNVPIDLVATRFGTIEAWAGGKKNPVVVYSASGRSADRAQRMLRSEGFASVVNAGGYERIRSDAEG